MLFRSLARLTGQMTAESAKTLKDLAEAATTLMEQFDERDRKTDKSTRKQITIAVWSVGISAVLALLALIVSGFAYLQDRDNGVSGDQWQAKLLTAIEQGNQQSSAIERRPGRTLPGAPSRRGVHRVRGALRECGGVEYGGVAAVRFLKIFGIALLLLLAVSGARRA